MKRSDAGEAAAAPDYFEPVIGWRSWTVIRSGADFRLRSIAFTDVWPVDEAFTACCYERVTRPHLRFWRRPPAHVPVSLDCPCGVHASVGVASAAEYLHLYDDVPQRSVCHRALGRVALWGTVVEGELGWRASRAYPREIFVPAAGARRGVGLDRIVAGLSAYGVPVRVLDDVDAFAATGARCRVPVPNARAR